VTTQTERVAQISAFASLGSLTITQELSGRIRQLFPDFDEEVVAEETLCFVSAVTAFSIGACAPGGVPGDAVVGNDVAANTTAATSNTAASSTISDLPFSYRDYVLGQLVLAPDSSVPESLSGVIGQRLDRKIAFYNSQLTGGLKPTVEKGLLNLAVLWMGRISVPGRSDSPETRVNETEVVDALLRHLTIVTSFTRHASK
jgi:hypothetical protein